MIFNYLKVGIRNFLKYKTFSLINVFGLAAAMSVCMLIMLMLADQRSYDQFHTNKDHIYRILSDKPDLKHAYATSPFPLADALRKEDPVVLGSTRLAMGIGGDAVYNKVFTELRGYFADTAFFKVFSFRLGKGDPGTALLAPNSIVLSADAARRLFRDEDPIGKTVTFTDRGLGPLGGNESSKAIGWGSYTITGVLEDANYRSHLHFDALFSASSLPLLITDKKLGDSRNDWQNFFQCYTYALLKPGKTGADLDASLTRLVRPHIAGISDLKGFNLKGQALTAISPGMLLGNESGVILPRVAYYFLSIIALVVLISACLNYTNLSIARAMTRAREIGIRKVNGAGRKNIVFQFLCESLLTALFALLLSILFLLFLRAAFVGLWLNQYFHFDLQAGWPVLIAFVAFALLIGAVAGIYPALYLSGFQPAKVLKSLAGIRPGRLSLRKILSVTQFAVSLIFIISTVLIFHQFTHYLKFKYEFTSNNIVNIPLQGNDYRMVARELNAVPGVDKISACEYIPSTGRSEGTNLKRADTKDEYISMTALRTDENFISLLQLPLVAGKGLPAGDTGRYVLLNESAVKALGFNTPSTAVGTFLRPAGNDSSTVQVAGVIKNFHLGLDHDQIEPLVLQNIPTLLKFVNVKIASADLRGTVSALEKKWRTIDPVHPFQYQFFDDQLAAVSQGLFDIVSILGYMAFIAITIASLGMLGMATYTTERRIKEVGIRKTLGGKELGIVMLLSKEFIQVLVIAILIAAPLSYFLNSLWLNKFPNRVTLGWDTILTGILILLIPGLAAIGSQTLRAARRNPVAALRTE
jgi:putative ABC transport system permease protein